MSDDALLQELMYWVRLDRDENGLYGDERTYAKKLSAEADKRRLKNV
jgi:hypothetical protein